MASATQNRTRIIIVLVILALLAGLGVTLGLALRSAEPRQATPPTVDRLDFTKERLGWAEPADYRDGRGVWIYKEEVLEPTALKEALKQAPVVELYYDYTCNFCNDLEAVHHGELASLQQSGQAIVVYHPTLTHAGPFALPATELALWTARTRPSDFIKLNTALLAYSAEHFTSEKLDQLSQNAKTFEGQTVEQVAEKAKTDPAAKQVLDYQMPMPKIIEIAAQAGIDQASVEAVMKETAQALSEQEATSPSPAPTPPGPVAKGQGTIAARDRFAQRMQESGMKPGTPKILINGKDLPVTQEFLNDPQGITKVLQGLK